MANTFAILTAIALAVAAFFAYKNQEELKREVQVLQEERNNLVINQEALQEHLDDRDEAIAQRRTVEEETVTLREQETTQQAGIDEIRTQITGKRETSDANAAKIAEIEEQTKEIGEIRELAGKIQRLKEEIADLEDQKVPVTARRRDLLAEKANIDSEIAVYESENTANRSGKSYFESTRISAVYPNWGFVTLGIGDTAGVVTGSTLDVIRGGEVVAQLRVRSVESNRSSADIIPDSVAEDVTLRPGDRVVPTSGSPSTAQAAN